MVADASGDLYFSDVSCATIHRVDPMGNVHLVAGTPGDAASPPPLGGQPDPPEGTPALTAQFNAPYGLALDDAGDLYVADRTFWADPPDRPLCRACLHVRWQRHQRVHLGL